MLPRTLFTSPLRASLCRVNVIAPSCYAAFFHRHQVNGGTDLSNSKKEPAHFDLSSFKQYAEVTGLDPESTVYRGTVYEYIVSHALFNKNMKLKRTGGRDDRGIDLRGEWHLPLPGPVMASKSDSGSDSELEFETLSSETVIAKTRPVNVIVQCKAHTTVPIGPNYVRELSGSLVYTQSYTIGFIASMYPCTTGARNAIRFSKKPMGFVCVSEEGLVKQLVWNRIASDIIGAAMTVGVKYTEDGETDIAGQMEQEAVLMFHDDVVDGLLRRDLEVEILPPRKERKAMEKEAKRRQKIEDRRKAGKEIRRRNKDRGRTISILGRE